MHRQPNTFDIREDRFAKDRPDGDDPRVELVTTHHYSDVDHRRSTSGDPEALTANEIVMLHRVLTLWINSVAGQQFLSDADITYRPKFSTAEERHPEQEACR